MYTEPARLAAAQPCAAQVLLILEEHGCPVSLWRCNDSRTYRFLVICRSGVGGRETFRRHRVVPLCVRWAPFDQKKNSFSIDTFVFIMAILVGYGKPDKWPRLA